MYSDVVIFIKRNQLTDAFCFIDPLKMRESDFLTEADAYPQLPTQANFFCYFQTNTALRYGHFELPHEEKSKFEFEEKKFSLLLKREVCGHFWLENTTFSNKLNSFFLEFKF